MKKRIIIPLVLVSVLIPIIYFFYSRHVQEEEKRIKDQLFEQRALKEAKELNGIIQGKLDKMEYISMHGINSFKIQNERFKSYFSKNEYQFIEKCLFKGFVFHFWGDSFSGVMYFYKVEDLFLDLKLNKISAYLYYSGDDVKKSKKCDWIYAKEVYEFKKLGKGWYKVVYRGNW